MSDVLTLQLPPPPSRRGGYAVRVGAGVAQGLGACVRQAAPDARAVGVVSDDNVWSLYGPRVCAALEHEGLRVLPQVVAPGEGSKSIEVVLGCVDGWATAGLTRRDAVVALGGGVVGDLAGLAAHLYMRGVPWVGVPTSLLAQVDASVGGKVAIDRPAAKNLLGAFHFPHAVLVDPVWLQTLPPRELACGAAEMIKHALLFSRPQLDAIAAAAPSLRRGDAASLAALVGASIALKAACVAADPFETEPAGRVLLNLGHTVGHAIEQVSGFAVAHGEAVALGLVAAARVSRAQGLAEASLERTVVDVLQRVGLPTALEPWLQGERAAALAAAIAHDKKRGDGGTITYIALAEVAEPRVCALTIDAIVAGAAGPPRS